MRAPGVSLVQIFGLKMGPEFHKIFKLFEELEEAGQTATLTFTSKGGKSTFKLQLESSPSSPSTTSPTPPAASAPAPGGRAAATVVQLQGPGADNELLTTRELPWQRQHLSPLHLPFLIQEKPVFQLAPSMASFLSVALYSPSSSPLHLPPQGDAGSCL